MSEAQRLGEVQRPRIEVISSSAVPREWVEELKDLDIGIASVQICRIPPLRAVQRHRHTGMDELIKNLDERPIDLILQKTRDDNEEVITLETGDRFIIPMNRLHIIRNGNESEVRIMAMGIQKTADGKPIDGRTIVEEEE